MPVLLILVVSLVVVKGGGTRGQGRVIDFNFFNAMVDYLLLIGIAQHFTPAPTIPPLTRGRGSKQGCYYGYITECIKYI
jgi:hypothetical protein